MIYSKLAEVFHYTPNEIAEMTPHQQLSLHSPNDAADILYFETHEEFLEWQTRRASR